MARTALFTNAAGRCCPARPGRTVAGTTPSPRKKFHVPVQTGRLNGRLNKNVKRRADVIGIVANEASIAHLTAAVLCAQNDEWQTASRHLQVEAFAQIDKKEIDPFSA